jgi:deoxycytidylate deaminase
MKTVDALAQAYKFALGSSDQSNQNGAVLVDAEGVIGCGKNDFPKGVKWTEERATTRPKKYRYYEHAEAWAIHEAACDGYATRGSTLYCPWAACANCARAIIVARVAKLIVHEQRMAMTPPRWLDDTQEAHDMMIEAGVEIEVFSGPIDAEPILVNGVLWSPKDEPKMGGNWNTPMGE